MNILLSLAFLFFIGCVLGWGIEVFFRRFISDSNPERKWINPGFCTGPYLPIYGAGLCIMYLIASLEKYTFISNPIVNKIILFVIMAVCMTLIEYVTGVFLLKVLKLRLWDYRKEWGNIQGVICPKFSFFWAVIGAVYYFFIHPEILGAIMWLSHNLAFSFFVGLFFGVFIIDVVHSANIVSKIKEFAIENSIEVRYELVKAHIRKKNDEYKNKYHFFQPFRSEIPLREHLNEMLLILQNKLTDTLKK